MAEEKFAKFGGVFPIERAPSGDGAIEMTLEEFAAADLAVEEALLLGKFARLAERLRVATCLLPLERTLAADIIENKLKPRKGRPKKPNPDGTSLLLALKVERLMAAGKQEKAAVSLTATTEKVSTGTVYSAVAAHPRVFEAHKRRARPSARSSK